MALDGTCCGREKEKGVHDYGGEVEATFCSATSCSCAEETLSCPSVTSEE